MTELNRYLGTTNKELHYISARKLSQYHSVSIPKRGGGMRLLSVPNYRLKFLQHLLNVKLQGLYSVRGCVHGFVNSKSALTNAQEHLGRRHLIKVDLKDYFDQISRQRVKGVLLSIGVPLSVAEAITNLCTLFDALPQGAPTSPVLANMVTFRLDQELVVFAKKNRLRYSRYADDIVLSSYSRPRVLNSAIETEYAQLSLSHLDEKLLQVFEHQGFELNEEKLYYCGAGARRSVTGYTINKFTNVPRKHVRRVRATLHNIRRNGYDAEQRSFSQKTSSTKSLKKSLFGQIEWIGATKGRSDPVFRRYAIEYNGLFAEKFELGPDLSRLSTLSTWVLETTHPNPACAGDTQGTAFFLKNVGLVTAAHCVPATHSYIVFCVDEPSKKYPVIVAKRHDLVDLAILHHSIPSEDYIELSRAEREPNVGEETSLWGFPAYSVGNKIEERRGRVVSHPTKSAVALLCVDQKINQGNSGGPLLNSAREVVGVAHKGGPDEAQDLA
ncbi:MAG: reverse transcriptase domain-containing protein, partial [Myxococcota bacterium]